MVDLTAYHTAEITVTRASKCAASLPLLSVSLHVTCPAQEDGVMLTQTPAYLHNSAHSGDNDTDFCIYFTGVSNDNAHYP